MKKNRMMRLASILLVCVLLTTSVISGTFAKYTSSAIATDTATVAKWSILVDGDEIATVDGSKPTVAVDLFSTVTEYGSDQADTEVADVDKLIAPGTQGSFKLNIKNESQVDAEYTITFEVTGAQVPLEWNVNGAGWNNSLNDVALTAIDLGTAQDVVIQWRWAFSTGASADIADTALGIAAGNVVVKATINVDQKD